jgi:hypothetical protein
VRAESLQHAIWKNARRSIKRNIIQNWSKYNKTLNLSIQLFIFSGRNIIHNNLRQFNESFSSPVEKSTSETGNSSLQPPNEKSSLSDETHGQELDSDTKRMEKDELNAIKFDVSLFWKLYNFANLDGADAVEPNNRFDRFEDEITRLPDARYCTPLPWTTDQWRLQRNFHLTAGRLENTLARLRKTPQDLADYS